MSSPNSLGMLSSLLRLGLSQASCPLVELLKGNLAVRVDVEQFPGFRKYSFLQIPTGSKTVKITQESLELFAVYGAVSISVDHLEYLVQAITALLIVIELHDLFPSIDSHSGRLFCSRFDTTQRTHN